MPIYRYVCETCNYDEEIIHSVKEIDLKQDSEYLKCKLQDGNKECKLRRAVNTDVTFGVIGSMSPNERKEVLLKRSHEHFNREMKEVFHEKNKKDYIP